MLKKTALLILFLVVISPARHRLTLQKKIIVNGKICLRSLFRSENFVFNNLKLPLTATPGYYYYTAAEIKKTVAAVLPGFKSVMIKGKGIEIYIQAPYSKTNQQKLTQYIIDRRQQTNADPGLFDRRGETEALAGKRYLLPAALKNHHRFRPGTEIIIEKKIPGSTIRIYGTLANWLIPGRYVKIKIKNSDKLIKEKIYKNKLFFN